MTFNPEPFCMFGFWETGEVIDAVEESFPVYRYCGGAI